MTLVKKDQNMQHHQTLYSLCLCLASFSLISLTSCDRPHKGEEDQLKETVDTFASAYFNWSTLLRANGSSTQPATYIKPISTRCAPCPKEQPFT